MKIDLKLLQTALKAAPQEETVDSSDVNPYLLNEILRPIRQGRLLRYGQVDFSMFELDDLRAISHYCDCADNVSGKLKRLTAAAASTKPQACTRRVFC